MEIISAEFVISNSDYTKCPNSQLPEYAFIGRSNVGKSSLINMLTNKKNLAKTSSKPGKTLLINHFLINQTWHLVDLPGYGYASIGKDMRQKLKEIIEGYLLYRPQLTNVFLLIDSRHAPQKIDMDFMQWMGENEIPFAIVFTKIDKLSQTKSKDNIEKYKDSLAEVWETFPKIFVTSSEKQQGREDLLDYIDEINRSL
ncbi:MAG TPA: ribosome biogenesis GTP-binding protein YihA/YsxC [Paludibacteraceae bacterium]|nr:ribosome biogenesis GTP-binding protein YihA/YsxC [Paludibacteraceae bacterium]